MVKLLERHIKPIPGVKYLLREHFEIGRSGICDINSKILTEQERRNVSDGTGMFLTGIAQRADALNANQRVYPYGVLAREVENYKKRIKENLAYGECVDEKTEILTTSGWKYVKDMNDEEEIYSLDVKTYTIKKAKATKVVKDFEGKMIHLQGVSMYQSIYIDQMLTPNHHVLMYRNDEPVDFYASEFVENVNKYSDCHFKSMCGNHLFNHVKVSEYEHSGKVYCVNVPETHTWLMRRNGAEAWTYNCDHPDDSVISFKNASHRCVDIWWDGKDVHVKLKIHTSTDPGRNIAGHIKDGGAVGLSSRGIGSVNESANGQLRVNEDLSLICFDIVTEPSTSGAFMNLMEVKKPLIEQYEEQFVTKAFRINRCLNDILC
jgi:hypothetical protein